MKKTSKTEIITALTEKFKQNKCDLKHLIISINKRYRNVLIKSMYGAENAKNPYINDNGFNKYRKSLFDCGKIIQKKLQLKLF